MDIIPVRCQIPDLLRSRGKTQAWLASEIGMSQQQLSDYCKLRFIMGLPTAAKIAYTLKVRIDDLYIWEWHGE